MTYLEFRDGIRSKLSTRAEGMTWRELKDELKLPYASPCPEWTKQLERDIGLDRSEKRGRAKVWRVMPAKR